MDNNKCSEKAWCRAMAEYLGEPFTKGLSVLVVMNLKTVAQRAVGVVYRRSSRDKGLMLNYCPWCGESILYEESAKVA